MLVLALFLFLYHQYWAVVSPVYIVAAEEPAPVPVLEAETVNIEADGKLTQEGMAFALAAVADKAAQTLAVFLDRKKPHSEIAESVANSNLDSSF